LKIVTSEIDVELNEEYRVIPGLGEFGDRYFGTDDWSCSMTKGGDTFSVAAALIKNSKSSSLHCIEMLKIHQNQLYY